MTDFPELPEKPCITTNSGYVDIFHPNPESYDIKYLALALSRIPRFGGHGLRFYSVLEHLLLCCDIAELNSPGNSALRAVWGHDLHEAITGDIPSPLKGLIAGIKTIEWHQSEAMAQRFTFDCHNYYDFVKGVDTIALTIEKRILFPRAGEWPCDRFFDEESHEKFLDVYSNGPKSGSAIAKYISRGRDYGITL